MSLGFVGTGGQEDICRLGWGRGGGSRVQFPSTTDSGHQLVKISEMTAVIAQALELVIAIPLPPPPHTHMVPTEDKAKWHHTDTTVVSGPDTMCWWQWQKHCTGVAAGPGILGDNIPGQAPEPVGMNHPTPQTHTLTTVTAPWRHADTPPPGWYPPRVIVDTDQLNPDHSLFPCN